MFGSLIGRFLTARAAGIQQSLIVMACLLKLGGLQVPVEGATLAELFNGGFVDVGNCRFDNWILNSLDSTATVTPDLSQIAVIPLTSDPSNPGLQFATNDQLSISGVNSIDLVFKFRVQALAGGKAFATHALALTGINFGSDGGLANISDEISNSSGADLGRTVVIADKESNFTKSLDTIGFAPQSEVFVVTNVFVNGLSATDAINLTSFTQAFSEIELAVLPGDYNHSGIVDAGDYVVWRDTLGQTGIGLAADGNANGQIDTADYDVWRAHFSHTAASGTLTGRAVSEPTTSFLLTLAIAGWCSGRRQKARHKNR